MNHELSHDLSRQFLELEGGAITHDQVYLKYIIIIRYSIIIYIFRLTRFCIRDHPILQHGNQFRNQKQTGDIRSIIFKENF